MLRTALALLLAACGGTSPSAAPAAPASAPAPASPSAIGPAIQLEVPPGFVASGSNRWYGTNSPASLQVAELDGPVFEGTALVRQSWQLPELLKHELISIEEVVIGGYPGVIATMVGEKDGGPNAKMIATFGDEHKHVTMTANYTPEMAAKLEPGLRRSFLGARWVGSGHPRGLLDATYAGDGLTVERAQIAGTGVSLRLPHGFQRGHDRYHGAGALATFTMVHVHVDEDGDLAARGSIAEFPDPGDTSCNPLGAEEVRVEGYAGVLVRCRNSSLPFELDRWILVFGGFTGVCEINAHIHDSTPTVQRERIRAALLSARWERDASSQDRTLYGVAIDSSSTWGELTLRKDGSIRLSRPTSIDRDIVALEEVVRRLRVAPPEKRQRIEIVHYANVDRRHLQRVERTLKKLGYSVKTVSRPAVVEVDVAVDSLTIDGQPVGRNELTTRLRVLRAQDSTAVLDVAPIAGASNARVMRVWRAGKRFGW